MPPVQGSTPTQTASPSAPQKQEKHGFWHGVAEWTRVIVIALVIALPIRFFIAEPFVVNGASMDPTFSTGQFLIVDRLTYDFKPPQRGEVIVFEYPNDPDIYYIKRIIGLPGETIHIKDGKVSIAASATSTPVALAESYIEAEHLSHDNLTTTTLGATEYFVMGDNRAQSSDSRAWGPLDSHFIIGRPLIRLTPFTSIGLFPGHVNETQTY